MTYFCFEEEANLEILVPDKCSRRIKKYDGKLMLVEVYMEAGFTSEPHTHPHEQMTYCLEGEFEFQVGDEVKVIRTGDTVYMPANILHNCHVRETGRLLDIFTPIREDFIH